MSLPPLQTLELRDLVFQSGHEAGLQLGFIFIDHLEKKTKKKQTNAAAKTSTPHCHDDFFFLPFSLSDFVSVTG